MGELRSIHNSPGDKLARIFTGRRPGLTSGEFPHMTPPTEVNNITSAVIRHQFGVLKSDVASNPEVNTSKSNVVDFRPAPPPPDPKLA